MLENKIGENYADALKDAIVLRRNDKTDPAVDTMLGHILYSISQWAIADAVRAGKLWRTFSQDEDFQADILLAVVNYANKVSLDRQPREILKYLYKCGRSAIRDQIMKANALKRRHESIELDGAVIMTDFYGKQNGVAYAIENEN